MTDSSTVSQPLVRATRGGLAESLHRGSIAAVRGDGQTAFVLGNPDEVVFLRSTAKPIQALPVIETGAADRFGFTPGEIAVMCGSLNGQDFQVEAVLSILHNIGLDASYLDCGVHRPSHGPTAAALARAGEKPTTLHNNCAGKHAAMLVLCVQVGLPLENYTRKEHPVQKMILKRVSELTGTPEQEIGLGIDGCGVPVFALPLINLALAYARLAGAAQTGQPEPAARLMSAMLAHPEMIAGDDRICTEVMRANQGKFLAKTGAEGSYALALPEKGLGVAFKVEDGHPRAVNQVVIEILAQLEQLNRAETERLAEKFGSRVTNHRGEEVGFIAPVFKLPGG